MKIIPVNLGHKQYAIHIERGLIGHIGHEIKKLFQGQKIAVITDEKVNRLYGEEVQLDLEQAGYKVSKIVIPPGEKSKSFDMLMKIYELLIQAHITRGDLIVTLGGGVVGDLGGFAAATFLRGIPFIQLPTTLLAQIDSSIGGKVAVNLPQGKNLVGCFYHPEAVFIDPELLNTLDKRYLRDGMAEVIKYACIRDRELFTKLSEIKNHEELMEIMDYIISTCCAIKKDLVERDERESRERMLLNFGHTLGHAIERYFYYEEFSHGEAVAVGMYIITLNSERLGFTEPGTSEKIRFLLEKFGLPHHVDINKYDSLLTGIRLDKKSRSRGLNLVLLKNIGKAEIVETDFDSLEKFFIVNGV